LNFSRQIFEKSLYAKLHENPSNRIPAVQCGRTDVMKPTVASRNFAKAPQNADSITAGGSGLQKQLFI
jgi:hypothetical protein